MKYKVRAIIPADDLGNTPARVLRKSGVVFINRKIWNSLSPAAQKFILLHEEGHHILDTSNEELADEYAFYRYAGSEKYSLKNTLRTITQTLDPERPDHYQRIKNIINHILIYDYLNNNNEKAIKMYAQININPKLEGFIKKQLIAFLKEKGIKSIKELPIQEREKLLMEFMNTPVMLELAYRKSVKEMLKEMEADSQENWGGRRKEIRELRKRMRLEKKKAKLKYIKEHPEEWAKKRKENLQKIKQVAVPVVGAVAGIAGAALGVPELGKVVGSVFGSKSKAAPTNTETLPSTQKTAPIQAPQKTAPTQAEDKLQDKKNNNTIYILGGLALAVILVVVLNRR